MLQDLVVQGHYADHTFTPDTELPDAEGKAELIIRPSQPASTISVFDLFGKAARLRSATDIAAQIQQEHDEWGEP